MPRRWLILLGLSLLSAAGPGAAAPARRAAELRGELQAKSQTRDDDKAQAQALREQIARLNTQLAELKAVAASGEKGLAGKRAQLAALNAQDAALQAQMGANQTALARLLGALELYRRDPPPALLVSPHSAQDAVRAAILIRAAQPELARRAAAFRAQAERLQRVRRAMDTVSEDLFTSESALADGRASIEADLRQKTALQRQLDADAQDADRGAQILARELHALGAPLTGPAFLPGAPEHAPTALGAPVDGAVTRRFGQAGGGPRAGGLTWRTAPGAIVRAPAAGIVEYAGALKGWDGVVILDVGGGVHLVLAGLDDLASAAGRSVRAGQTLGAMARRGAGPPELYMELRKDGEVQDPARLLRSAPLARAGRRG